MTGDHFGKATANKHCSLVRWPYQHSRPLPISRQGSFPMS
jgi:hypothetical protein